MSPGTDVMNDRKRYATLAAKFALHGHELRRVFADDGSVVYQVARWGRLRSMADLDAASAFLAQIEGVS